MDSTFYITARPASRPGTWRLWGSHTLLPGDTNDFAIRCGANGRKVFSSWHEAIEQARRIAACHHDWVVVA